MICKPRQEKFYYRKKNFYSLIYCENFNERISLMAEPLRASNGIILLHRPKKDEEKIPENTRPLAFKETQIFNKESKKLLYSE